MEEKLFQKAEELRPDLIVLDVGLPKLNGIEAPILEIISYENANG